jgi:ribosomal protein L29
LVDIKRMDKIIVEYQLKTEELRKELGDVKKQLSDTEKQVETSGSKMSNTFKNVGKAIAGAFAIREIVQFGQEVEALARKADGVEKAFNNIASVGMLDDLRKATRGTVSDLSLMQAAVKANNFRVPLEQLASYFSFATQRARETGESVSDLVQNIVEGIGTNSIAKLDNLGIKTLELREEFAKTGDLAVAVGNIIQRGMEGAADSTTEAADAADRAAASFENLKVEIGQRLMPVLTDLRIGFNRALEGMINFFDSSFVTTSEKTAENIRLINIEIANIDRVAQASSSAMSRYTNSVLLLDEKLRNTKGYEARQAIIKQIVDISNEAIAANQKNIDEYMASSSDAVVATGIGVQKANDKIKQYISSLTAGKKPTEDLNKETKKLTEDMAIFKEVVEKIPSLIQPMVTELDRLRAAAQDTDFSDFYGSLDEQQGFLDIQNELIFSGQQLNPVVIGLTSAYQSGVITLEQYSDLLKQIKEDQDTASDSLTTYLDNFINGFGAASLLFGTYGELLTETADKQSALAAFGRQLAFFEIASAQAVAVANAVKVVTLSAKNPVDYFVFLATLLSSVGVSIGKAKALIEGESVPQFATGVVDLKGSGTETSDSIHARLSKGESVITAKGTRQDKGLFEAANKLKLEEYINKNYVLPVLMQKEKERGNMFDDYRLYLAMMNNQRAVKDGSRQVVEAIKRRARRYDWN